MTTENPDYTLYYWPVPFRGHFIRAILTYAGANWAEGDDVAAVMSADADDQPVPFMGPPMLVDHRTGFAVSQMPAIAFYLGEQFGLVSDTPENRALCLKVVNDANDVIDELTIQGGMEMWTDKKWQAFEPRLKRWMSFWEVLGGRHGLTETSGYLLGTPQPTIADIVTATLWMTARERFPLIGQILDETAPRTAALAKRLWATPVLAKFAQDTTAQYGDSYCGGQIEQSLRKVLNHE